MNLTSEQLAKARKTVPELAGFTDAETVELFQAIEHVIEIEWYESMGTMGYRSFWIHMAIALVGAAVATIFARALAARQAAPLFLVVILAFVFVGLIRLVASKGHHGRIYRRSIFTAIAEWLQLRELRTELTFDYQCAVIGRFLRGETFLSRCQACSYDLRGITPDDSGTMHCPECGSQQEMWIHNTEPTHTCQEKVFQLWLTGPATNQKQKND